MRLNIRKTLAGAIISTAASLAAAGLIVPSAFADMNGIDVSSWQCGINMSAVPGDFAIVKATQATGYVNPCMTAQLEGARSAGKSIGTYHYAAGGNAVAEADYYISKVSSYIRKGILVLDWESYQNAAWGNGAWVRTWVNRVHERTGIWPVIYVQSSAVNQIPSDVWANCMLWKAQYASMNPTGYQSSPWNMGSHGEGMIQYTSAGVLAGYGGYLDLNLFRGDRTAWNKIATAGSGNVSGGSTGGGSGSGGTSTPTVSGTTAELVQRVLRGDFGNIPQRQQLLGSRYQEVQDYINRMYSGGSSNSGSSSSGGTSVTVRSGDTISSIAARTGLYPLSAWRVPSGNINVIYPGQVVTFGGSSGAQSSGGHVVRSGESLWSIYGTGWSAAAARNGISYPYTIYPGQVLR